MKNDRLQDLEKYVMLRGSVSMTELQAHFNVSMNTVRRDVAELVSRGALEKVYGGVCIKRNETPLTPYEERRTTFETEKRKVGLRAAQLVQDGDIIFIDSGTTTLQMIDGLRDLNNVTIVTNNLEAILKALPYENISIVALPGQVRRKTNSMAGFEAVETIRHFNIRTAFIAATGLSTHGATNSSNKEYEIKRTAVQLADKTVLLIDGKKFGKTGLMTFASLNEIDTVVTDQMPEDEDIVQALSDNRVQVIVAD